MGIATPQRSCVTSQNNSKGQNPKIQEVLEKPNSMSQDYHHQSLFSFPNGFERTQVEQQQQQQQQQHMAQQIRRDKLRVQGFEHPPTFEEEETGGGIPVYHETAGMLSEMFNFPQGTVSTATATELLESQFNQQFRHPNPNHPRPQQHQSSTGATGMGSEWFGNRQGMIVGAAAASHQQQQHVVPLGYGKSHNNQIASALHADSAAAAMQLFLMNPPQQPGSSPSSSPSPSSQHHHHHNQNQNPPSTLHMLLPNPQGFPNPAEGSFGPFTAHLTTPNEIGAVNVVESQGLSLSLSSSLHPLDATKESEMLFFNQAASSSGQFRYKNNSNNLQQVHVGYGSSLGVVNVLRNSKYAKAAQELLEEFCSVGRGKFKKQNNNNKATNNPNSDNNPSGGGGGGNNNNSSSSSKDHLPPLSAADRIEHQRRKVKLLSMLDEVDRRYNHYCEQMQMVVNSFDLVMGFGAAIPYTALAQKAMSRHFRCLKDAIGAQLKHSCELLGDKDAGSSGLTKGETPRLKMLEQSLRQQRAFHQMGMMEQEAWRPQRGLPERSVNILRAWLFEHFLHPYPSDADKHLLARQTGLSRNQVSNWFINARVRLWKPMVEDMYQQESKEEEGGDHDTTTEKTQSQHSDSNHNKNNNTITTQTQTQTQTPTPNSSSTTNIIMTTTTTATETGTAATAITTGGTATTALSENDPSLIAINSHISFSENQANFPTMIHDSSSDCRRGGNFSGEDYGTTGSTMIRFGTTTAAGDVSLTLGLRHAGNLPENHNSNTHFFG